MATQKTNKSAEKTEKATAKSSESAPVISRHKRPSTRQTAAAGASQAFDIIPPSRVMPSASARPVITANKPQQSDNTLTAASSRRPQRTMLSPKPELAVDDDGALKLPPLPIEDLAGDEAKLLDTEEQATESQEQAQADDTAQENTATAENVLQLDDATPVDDAADDDPASKAAAEQAAAEEQIARALAGEGEDQDETIEVSKPEAADTPLQTSESEPVAAPKAESVPSEPAPVAETPAEKPDSNIRDDSVAAVLAADDHETRISPQAHTPALKDALQDLDDSQPQHHALYGGKPVIVIHKARGSRSALSTLVWIIVCLLLAVAIVDVLIDANIISLSYDIPHTNFL